MHLVTGIGLLGRRNRRRRRRIGDAIVAGYEAQPQTASELGWADEATVAMISAEPW